MGTREIGWIYLHAINPISMRNLLSLLLFLGCALLQAQQWESSFENAQTKAAAENKKVLLVFSGSDWCIPCIRLEDKVWKSQEFINYAASSLYLYRADFPKRKKNQLPADKKAENEALAALYNKKGYFPWVVVFSANGKAIGAFAYEDKAVSAYLKAIESFE